MFMVGVLIIFYLILGSSLEPEGGEDGNGGMEDLGGVGDDGFFGFLVGPGGQQEAFEGAEELVGVHGELFGVFEVGLVQASVDVREGGLELGRLVVLFECREDKIVEERVRVLEGGDLVGGVDGVCLDEFELEIAFGVVVEAVEEPLSLGEGFFVLDELNVFEEEVEDGGEEGLLGLGGLFPESFEDAPESADHVDLFVLPVGGVHEGDELGEPLVRFFWGGALLKDQFKDRESEAG